MFGTPSEILEKIEAHNNNLRQLAQNDDQIKSLLAERNINLDSPSQLTAFEFYLLHTPFILELSKLVDVINIDQLNQLFAQVSQEVWVFLSRDQEKVNFLFECIQGQPELAMNLHFFWNTVARNQEHHARLLQLVQYRNKSGRDRKRPIIDSYNKLAEDNSSVWYFLAANEDIIAKLLKYLFRHESLMKNPSPRRRRRCARRAPWPWPARARSTRTCLSPRWPPSLRCSRCAPWRCRSRPASPGPRSSAARSAGSRRGARCAAGAPTRRAARARSAAP